MVRERSGTLQRMGEFADRTVDKVKEMPINRDIHRTSTLGLKGRPLRWLITTCATVGFSLFGYNQGMMSGIVTGEEFTAEFPVLGTASNASVLQGGVTACYELGCFFGALMVLFIGERVGRKPLIATGAFILMIGVLISVTSFGHSWGLGQFVIGRVISGMGNGFNTATIPVWQSEMARPELRGRLVQLEGSVVAFGTMIAYWIDFGLSYVDSSVQWRFPVAMQIFFGLIVFCLVLGLPESPRWLIAHGREDEARPIIAALEDVYMDDEIVEYRLATAKEEVSRMGNAMRFRDLLTRGKTAYMQRMLIGASTQFFQQFSGCNAAIYYSTVLFELMQLGRRMSLTMGGVFASVYALMTLPAFWLIEHLGRRGLFLMGSIGQGCSFVITMGCLTQVPINSPELTDHQKEMTKGAAVGLYLFISFFGMSILGLPWIYPPEINPLKTRTAATAVSTCTNWLSNFAVVMFTPEFVHTAGWGAYLFFLLMNFIWVPLIYFFYPETAGRSLEEIDIIFARAHEEGKLPFMIANSMPKLSLEEVSAEAKRLGLHLGADDDEASLESSFEKKGPADNTSATSSAGAPTGTHSAAPAQPAAPAAAAKHDVEQSRTPGQRRTSTTSSVSALSGEP